MRRMLAVLPIAIATMAPATAAPRTAEDREVARMADRLNDPRMQAALSGMMLAMADMVMDLRIDRFRDAMARVDPDSARDDWDDARTLGDVIRRDDPDFRERIEGQSRIAVGTAGSMAAGMADMVPELRAMAERMGREVERATRGLPR